MKYVVTITKTAVVEIEAESAFAAEQIVADQDSDAIIEMDRTIEAVPAAMDAHTLAQWIRKLDDEHNVSVYESIDVPGQYGFTGCDFDDYESRSEAVAAALKFYGMLEEPVTC